VCVCVRASEGERESERQRGKGSKTEKVYGGVCLCVGERVSVFEK